MKKKTKTDKPVEILTEFPIFEETVGSEVPEGAAGTVGPEGPEGPRRVTGSVKSIDFPETGIQPEENPSTTPELSEQISVEN